MSGETLAINKAEESNLEAIFALLELVNLPTGGVKENINTFFILQEIDGTIKGCIGLELYNEYALLRSAAIHPENQGQGLGSKLTAAVTLLAKELGVRKLYLITETAKEFFERKGFTLVSKDEIPESVKGSVEFTFRCAEKGVTMIRELE